jgi:TonB family protein
MKRVPRIALIRSSRAAFHTAIAIAVLVCAFAVASKISTGAPLSPTPPPTNQTLPNQPQVSSSEIDALAADVAQLIAKEHLSKVAVFGALGPTDRITPMGLPIGDAFSASLANHAQKFTVIDRSALRETLKQQHVAEKMLSSNVLAAWISSMVKADCIAIVKLENFSPSDVMVALYLYNPRKVGSNSFANRKVVIQLDYTQVEAIKTTLNTPIKKDPDVPPGVIVAGRDGVVFPSCEYCPRPDYTQEARGAHQQGDIWLNVTVTADGRPTEIEVTKPMGYGMDALAVETIQKWRFRPAKDSDGNPVSAVTGVQVEYQLFPPGPSNSSSNAATFEVLPSAGSNPAQTPSRNNLPICLHCPRPDYSKEAKKKKIEGTVWLDVLVTPTGDVAETKVTKSLGYGLDEEAIKAVMKWKFRPLIGPDGKPVEVHATVQLDFKLY